MFESRVILLRSIIICGLIVLVSCSNGEPIKIGFVGGMSGRVADLGINGRNGAQLAVNERNQTGGINGRPVELLIVDDKQDKETALKSVVYLLEQNVSAIIGHMTSSMTIATLSMVNKSKSFMVSPTATSDILSGKDDSFLRVSTTTQIASSKMANYLLEKTGIRKVSAIYDLGNNAYTESWLLTFKKVFESGGGTVLRVEKFTSGNDASLFETVKNAYDDNAQGVVIISSAMDAAMICQQVKKIDWQTQLVLSEWSATEALIDLGGKTVEGALVSQFFDHDSTLPRYTSFKNRYQKSYSGLPGFAAVNAYDATTMVMDALAAKRPTESLKDSVLRISSFQGIQGQIHIDQYGDANRPTKIGKINNSKIMVIE